jgi:pyruvate/2-oxoglutarate dehydrogenase complex dihydrolipoamide dehydrogenase (E3) component
VKVVVLGGGSSGEHFVGALRRLDAEAQVTLVERRLVGGECSYWACMPTKTMLRAPEVRAEALRTLGALDPGPLDAAAVFAWRDVVAERDDSSQVAWLASMRAELVRGDGVVAEPGVVRVDGAELAYDRLVIATGSSPVVPPVVDGLDYWTNREATEATELPGSLLVLGGGPVGSELAQFFARLGSRVTLVQSADRLLPRVDADAAALVEAGLRDDGVQVRLGAAVDGDEVRRYDRVLVATGRRANVDGLDGLGLTITRRGIEVDERMRAAENVWAIGDVNGVWPLTYVGKYQGRVVASNILGTPRKANFEAVPRVVFTDPQAASVGEAEGELEVTAQLKDVARTSTYTRAYADKPGFMTLVSDGERITGAYALGPEAGEWLQQATLAIRARVPLEVMQDTIQPFPTFSEVFLDALTELGAKVPAAA